MNGKRGTYYEIEQLQKRVELLEGALETLGIIKSKYAQNDFSPDEHDGHKEKELVIDKILEIKQNQALEVERLQESHRKTIDHAREKFIKEKMKWQTMDD